MRDWIKPELVVEKFELSQHVASGCGIILGRTDRVSFTVYGDDGKHRRSGVAYDGSDSNNYLDAAELRQAVLSEHSLLPGGHQAGAYYTIGGETYRGLPNPGSWPFSS